MSEKIHDTFYELKSISALLNRGIQFSLFEPTNGFSRFLELHGRYEAIVLWPLTLELETIISGRSLIYDGGSDFPVILQQHIHQYDRDDFKKICPIVDKIMYFNCDFDGRRIL